MQEIFVYGGISTGDFVTDSAVYALDLSSRIWKRIETNMPSRFSHCCIAHQKKLIILGGSSHEPIEAGIIVFDTSTYGWTLQDVLKNEMVCKFGAILFENKLLIVGGGAHCFSFGMYYVGIVCLDFKNGEFSYPLPLMNSAVCDSSALKFDPSDNESAGSHACLKCTRRFVSRNKLFEHIKNH